MQKKIQIKELKLLKEGEGQYGKWQLIKAVSEEGEEFVGFNPKKDPLSEGEEYLVTYHEEEGKFGKELKADKWEPPYAPREPEKKATLPDKVEVLKALEVLTNWVKKQ